MIISKILSNKTLGKKQAAPKARDLTLAEVNAVSGGLNPQPLPPSHDPHTKF